MKRKIPVLAEAERAALIAFQAEARIKAGEGIDYDLSTFKDRLLSVRRRASRDQAMI